MKQGGSGNYRWFLARALPVRDERGKLTRWFGTCTDIHEQKVTLTRLSDANAQLLALNARFQSVVQQSPYPTQILNPMGRTIHVNAAWQHLWGISDTMRDEYIEVVPFSIHRVVTDVARVLQLGATAKGVQVTCNISNNIPARVVGDPTRLKQVLVNLGNNAIKFTHVGTIQLDVERGDNHQSGLCRICFRIKDSGIGIGHAPLWRNRARLDHLPHSGGDDGR